MQREQISKFHKIIRIIRKPLCLLIVLTFVFCYSISSFAETVTFNNYVSWSTFSGYSPDVTYPILTDSNANTYATEKGFDYSKVSSNSNILNYVRPNYSPNVTTFNNKIHTSGYTFPTEIIVDGVTYDTSNAYWFVFGGNFCVVLGSGRTAIVDRYIVSDEPFRVTVNSQPNSNGVWSWNGVPTLKYATSLSQNGYYCMDATQFWYNWGTNLSIYCSSNDGSSGFTNFSTTSTDFDFDNENFDFNFQKSDFGIIAGGDPVPITPDNYGDYAKSRMNFSMTSYYTGGKYIYNAKHDVSIIWPEVVKNNPENFYIVCHYTGVYKDGSLANAITFDEREALNRRYIKVSGLMKNGKLPNNFEITCGLNELVDSNNKSMWEYFLESISAISGASSSSVSSDSLWMQFLNNVGQAVSDLLGIGEDEKPLAKLSPAADAYISTMRIDGYVSLCYDNGVDSYNTGENHSYYDFTTGESNIVSTDNTINQYPTEGQDVYNLPSTGSNGDLGTVVQGDVNTTSVETNFNAFVEYMFHIDPSDILGMQASMTDQYNFVKNTITDNGSNGFLKLLSETFDIIPSEIWNWIKASVAMVLMVCTWKIFISNKRLTG